MDKHIKNDPRMKQVKKLAKDATAYGKKHKLNLDDGGGGSKKAGEKYISMWEKHDYLLNDIRDSAYQKTTKQLKNKYGEKRIKQIGRQNTAISLAIFGGIAISTVATFELTKQGIKMTGRAIKKTAKYAYNAVKGGI